jgi:hypothetical protein
MLAWEDSKNRVRFNIRIILQSFKKALPVEIESELVACFKTPDVLERAKLLHSKCIEIMADMYQYAVDNNLPFTVTAAVSTYAEDLALNRVSATHRERRAFDISDHGWSSQNIQDFCEHFNFKYADIAAISNETGKPLLVYHHDNGHGYHFHVQIHKRYAFEMHS